MFTINNRYTKILVFFVCLALGFMITMQLKSKKHQSSVVVQRAEELSVRLKEAEADRDKLAKQLDEIKSGEMEASYLQELERVKSRAGETALEGKGVILTIDDSKQAVKAGENKNLYIIHDEDLLRVVNELRAAGAEAISLNGQRLTAASEIRCVGPTVLVNETRLAAPFVISAIGDPQTLESSLKLRGGVLENFKFWGIRADVKKSDQVKIPAAKVGHEFQFAKVAKEEPKEAEKEDKAASAKNESGKKDAQNGGQKP